MYLLRNDKLQMIHSLNTDGFFLSELHCTIYHVSVNNDKSLDHQNKECHFCPNRPVYERCRWIPLNQKLSGQEGCWQLGRRCLTRRFHCFLQAK